MKSSEVFMFVILLWVFFYTASFGKWVWKDKNKFGSIMIFVLALSALILPIYTYYFRG